MPHDDDLSADHVVALPLDELALRVLADFKATGGWNWRNWLVEREQGVYQGRPDALRALSEAWGWIIARGLVARTISQSSAEAVTVSRLGEEVLRRGAPYLRAVQRLDVALLPELEAQARPQFLRGDFEAAAFMAMNEVEVAVREAGDLDPGLVGTKLMQEAFKSGGPLHQAELDPGESVATMELFKGAIGLFKNPSSHRRVDFSDPTEAAEVVLLADLLLRVLQRSQKGK